MTARERYAVELLNVATDGHCDVYRLAGPSNARNRAVIMSTLTGVRTPQAKAGVHAMREAFYTLAGITNSGFAFCSRAHTFLGHFILREESTMPRGEFKALRRIAKTKPAPPCPVDHFSEDHMIEFQDGSARCPACGFEWPAPEVEE